MDTFKQWLNRRGILLCLLFFIVQASPGQLKYNVKIVKPGFFGVEIIPEKTIEDVRCKILLTGPNKRSRARFEFTTKGMYTLFPKETYYREFPCDRAFTAAIGDSLFFRAWTPGTGGATADVASENVSMRIRSGSNFSNGKKIVITGTEDVPLSFPGSNKQYIIRQFNDQKVITLFGSANDPLSSVEQMSYKSMESQLWNFTALSGADRGYFLIHPSQNRNMCLEALPGSDPEIVQSSCDRRRSQQWKIVDHGGNYFIQSKVNNHVMTSHGIVGHDRWQISLTGNTYMYHQQWQIKER